MNRITRFIIALIVTLIGFFIIVKVRHIPAESYLPPPKLYSHCTAKVYGQITGTESKGLSEHILEGSDTFDYIDYTFQPKSYKLINPDGTKQVIQYAEPFTGSVRVASFSYNPPKPGTPVLVVYDPLAPKINGVPNTLGLWSRTTGYLNPYLWWWVGIFIIAFILQEIMRVLTRTNDLR